MTLAFPLPFTAALLAALMTLTVLRDRAATPRARSMFALFLASVALLRVLAGLRLYGVPAAGPLQAALAMTPAPLSYLAFRALTAAKTPPWWADLARHFSPVLLVLALEVRPPAPLDLPIVASFATYAVLLAGMWRQGPDVFVNTSLGEPSRMRRLLLATVLLHALSALSDFALFLDFAFAGGRGAPVILAALNIVLIGAYAVALLVRPDALPPPQAPAAVKLPPSPEDEAMVQRLDALMAAQRLYCDPALTIARLAKRAGVPSRRVSQAVNRARGLNVSQYINNHRVAEAQRLLATTERPVTEVMLDCGFLTKSNFNREFRRVTGASPSLWRRGSLSPATASASAVASGEDACRKRIDR